MLITKYTLLANNKKLSDKMDSIRRIVKPVNGNINIKATDNLEMFMSRSFTKTASSGLQF